MDQFTVDNISEKEMKIWLEKAKNGDSEYFRRIYTITVDSLFSYALSRSKSREDAMDIVQETYIDLWKSLRKFKYRSSKEFLGFLYTILKRRIYKHYRLQGKVVKLEECEIENSYQIEVEDYRYLEKSLTLLPEGYQELIRLRYFGNMSFREVSACLEIKESTAKVWHHRALKLLGANLKNYSLN